MRKFIPAAVIALALAAPAVASADVTNNGTTNDAQGYCIANHIHNGWSESTSFNGDFNGIGHLRSQQTGKQISSGTGNRAPADQCVDTQGIYGPIND